MRRRQAPSIDVQRQARQREPNCPTNGVRLVDDLDGGDAAESIGFAIDGKAYEIDPNEKHAAQLRDVFAPFVSCARRPGTAPASTRQKPSARTAWPREETAAIREWAAGNGYEVSTRGRIPATVIKAYEDRDSATAIEEPAVEEPKRRGKGSDR